jgi:quercetin dioxygenase-like cupin family protein
MRAIMHRLLPSVAMAAVAGGFAAYALASPPSGQHPTTPAVGTLAAGQQVNTDRLKFQTKDDADVATFSVTYDPRGFSGWHTHPGIVFVVVQSGSVIRQVGCDSHTYSAGDSFIESDEQPAGQVSNPSATTSAVLTVMQIVPHGSPRRVEANPPSC